MAEFKWPLACWACLVFALFVINVCDTVEIFSDETSSIEQIDGVDTDLVFDSLEQSNSNNENHHRKQKHSRIGHEIDPPFAKQQEEESHWLSGTVNRIKRSISSLFSKGEDQKQPHAKHEKREANHAKHEKKEEKGKKRKNRQLEQQETVDDEYDDNDNVVEESSWDDNHLNVRPDDDEDALDVQSGRGSGEIDSSTSDFPVTFPHSHPRVYRFAVTIMEPYMDDYEDRNSPAFQDLAQRIKRSFEQAFENVPGTQTANVISIQSSKSDRFNILATVDVDSTGYSETEGIRNAIYEKVFRDHRVGNLTVIPENFSFREFGASHPRCDQNQMQCLSGECVPTDSRCDGKQDCPDNSDEEGCRDREGGTSEEIIPHSTSSPPAHFPRTEEPEVEGSGDEGNCRADDAERCADGSRIICADQKCDGHPDCDDGGDERDCPTRECAVGEFKCDIRRCIPVNQLCDGKPDCSDLSDEQNCQCSSDEFRCNTGQCIPSSQRCDGAAQCRDNSDEVNCQKPTCRPDEFDCRNGECIPRYSVCDSKIDCRNGIDEVNCTRGDSRCRADEFTCANHQQCVPIAKRCDLIHDCSDLSDERNCPCKPTDFHCHNGFCIPHSQRCDGIRNCQDGSDELECANCEPYQWRCHDGTCIDQIFRCNLRPDCPDGSDESAGCAKCAQDQFRCNDGICLSLSKVCDGVDDCTHSEDEESCPNVICTSGQFTCASGQCVPESVKCNGHQDCYDNSDESDCNRGPSTHCPEGEFQCAQGFCIMGYKRCNGIEDCPSGNDEWNCPVPTYPPFVECSVGEVRCHDGSCTQGAPCDGYIDCPDRSDEQNCTGVCSAGQFRCADGACIDERLRCDGYPDCRDSSDERNCVPECPSNQIRCESGGSCVDSNRRCDGYADCPDASDERGCRPTNASSTTFSIICGDDEFNCGDECIENAYRCDGLKDCKNGKDEEDCRCGTDQFQCQSDNMCIDSDRICDGNSDCADNSDERDCNLTTVPPIGYCARDELRCDDGTCVPTFRQCDGRPDCPDGTDERGCPCRNDQFPCLDGSRCIDSHRRCDRWRDCTDGSDEADCPTSPPSYTTPEPTTPTPPGISCQPGYRPCKRVRQCIRADQLCDGTADCSDFSDEDGCPYNRERLDLHTYPDAQEQKERQEVVFTCRDEGPLRVRVHWERENGLPLPPGSTDVNGRLEMPNIQLEHQGTYVCVAEGYPKGTPGAEATVQLKVAKRIPPPSLRPPTACGLFDATCANGDCIPKNKVCDGHFDCGDGSDENRCNPSGCEPNQYQCQNKKCILKTWRCDSDDDCGDGSDEEGCAVAQPGSLCGTHQFQCRSGNQCIPRSYHCDLEKDCVDGSDEVGCVKPVVYRPPPPMVNLVVGDRFEINCTAVGVPTPLIVWRLNWRHVPAKCRSHSENGVGTLVCDNIQIEDQGAYSCEAINIKGVTFAHPDTILMVNRDSLCRPGYFNVQARNERECIKCFCFGQTSTCRSADLFIYQFQPPFDSLKLLGVRVDPIQGIVDIRDEPIYRGNQPDLTPAGAKGVHAAGPDSNELNQPDVWPYFAMPENYHGNQLKSYGGYLRYSVSHSNRGYPSPGPDVIISGNGYILQHQSRKTPAPYQDDSFEVRFFEGEWYKKSPSIPESMATREEIMMVLEDIDNILIKLQYNSGVLNTTLSNIAMDSAATPDSGLGPASYVEDCSCPAGYSGSSCERCSEGFTRRKTGPWLGQCLKEQPSCPPGMYNDGRECQICPCPHTNPSNQFGRTCHLGSDGDVVCDCPPGYVGNRCQQCAEGYIGNPLIPGDSCVPDRRPPEPYCDLSGSLDTRPDPYGRCRCKDLTEGPSCNQCKANTFHLSSKNQFGCISCFCMGVSMQCSSSNWYRDKITTYFTSSINNFKIIDNLNREYPITEGISLNQQDQAISFSGFSSPNAYYWSLPSLYLGNKITSYGGFLRYTLKHSPVPGGQSSRNVAADVELISRNNINLLYYNRNQSYPTNAPQTFVVPLLEQYWQRSDGQQADREHLLMVLADLENIYIKATYYTQTSVSSLISVELDTATDRNTGSTERALEVEQCHCPPGYTGLSCEDCDVGYSRTTKGLYLGTCEQCNCNGHSDECDAESGICLNCRDHTTGDNCELCLPGYEGSPSNGGICTYTGTEIPCSCDPRGSVSSECYGGRCRCKTNVEGNNCDRCRSGTFGLSMNNIDGCEMCFCFGESSQCSESNLYIEQIPIQILQDNHGFTITDQFFVRRVSTNFSVDMFRNEISYPVPPGTRDTLYWSLPSIFTGNKVKSYGGQLEFVQRYTHYPSGRYIPNKDVIINGNGKTIYWSHPGELRPDVENPVSVQLHPSARWFVVLNNMPGSPISRTYRIDGSYGTKPASREDILMVLANIDSILIRATPSSDTRVSYLSDITLDTAVDTDTGKPRATSIEVCRCPPGYRGTSCESCASGYYKDYYFDSQKPLGTCQRCPCNDREEGCEMGPDRRVVCHCRPGYTGINCEHEGALIKVDMDIQPSRVVAPIGSQVKFSCKFVSEQFSGLNITVEGLNLFNIETIGNETTFYHVVGCYQQQIRCVARNRLNQEVGYVSADVYPAGISSTPYPDVNPTHVAPSIDLTIEDHHIGIYEVGSTVRYNCSAKSQYSPRNVQVHWSKDGGSLPSRAIDDGRGLLVITNLKVTDSGRYICEASDGYSIASSSVNLNVGVKEDERPRIAISEPYVEIDEGRPVDVRCVASGVPAPELSLTRLDGQQLDRRYFSNGVFHIPYARESDSGTYQCTATNRAGSDYGQFQLVVRRPNVGQHTNLVRVDIAPSYFTGVSGDTIRLNCSAPVNVNWIRWSKQSGNLPYNYQEDRGGLVIPNATPDASGVYICTVMSSQGTSNTSSVSVSIRGSDISEYPTAKVSPNRITLQQGQSTELNCMATGRPTPTVKWTKLNGELARNIEQQGPVLYIRNARVEDRGIYVCVATNDRGIAQSSVVVEVTALEMPRVEIHPGSSQTVIAGGSAIVQCRVMEGRPTPTVTWRRADNRPLSRNVEEMSGGTLRFMDVNVGDQGEYICTATNEAGTVTASHHLIVHTAPEVQITPSQDTISRPEGESLRLICQATGTPEPTVQWSKYGEIPGHRTDNLLTVPNVAYQEFNRLSRDDQGVYVCRAESSAGIVENRIQLIIEPRRGDGGDDATHPGGHWKDNEPTGGYHPNPSPPEYDEIFKAAVGARAEIRCSIKDIQGSRIDISWIRTDNTSLQRNAYERSGTLYIDNVQPSDAGVYRCIGIDQTTRKVVFGLNTYLKVLFPPRITLIPPRQVVHPGDDAYINCSSTGEQPIQTWWEAVGRTMPASVYTRDGHLRFNNIQLSDTGRYLCKARNNAGEAEAVADVIVEENISKPAITAEQKQQDAPLGSNVRLGCRTASDRKSIRWYRQNQPLPQNAQVADEVLYIPNVQYQDQGRYFCELSTKEGTVSDYIDLQVSRHVSSMTAPQDCPREWYRCRNGFNCIPPEKMCDYNDDCGDNSDEDDCKPRIRRRGPYSAPSLYITPPDSDPPHRPGSNVDIACQSSERGAITTWSKPSGWMLDNVRLQGGRMRIERIRQDNAGVYRCEATGQQGVYHKDYQLRVADEEVKDEPPLEVKSVPRGSNVVLECKTNFNSPNSYKWSKQGGILPNYIDIYSSTLQLNDVGSTDAGTYTCTATSGSRTIDVPFILVVTGIVPHFAQAPNSYITLPTLMDSYIQFAFEISFKPENGNGLILYNGNRGSEKNGDFIALLLVDSVPEFKFNLGSGTATLQADRPLSNQQWHTIKVVRNRKKATMFVDGEGPFVSVADGKYIGLDLTEPLYLGGVPNPNNISPDVFTYSRYIGFVGCISRFKIGHNHVDIMREALNKTGLTSCETCSEDKCENKGACQEALTKEGFTCICPSGFSGATCNKLKGEACSPYACGVGRCIDLENTFICECPLGRAGRRCEREITVNEPAFQNDAYIAYPPPKPNRRLKITLKVKPNSHEDGLLLYCGETEEGHGDFVSLAVKDGRLEFRFDAGNGPVVIRHREELQPGKWHVLTASRSLSDGRLLVDGTTPVVERLSGNHKTLNLQTPLYVGGYDKHHIKLNNGVQVFRGFDGCISNINIGGTELNVISNATDASNVGDCSEFSPDEADVDNNIYSSEFDNTQPKTPDLHRTGCSGDPCKNGGQCYPLSPMEYRCSCLTGYTGINCETELYICDQRPCQNQGICKGNNTHYSCDCPLGYTGYNCEQVTELQSDAHFDGDGYLEFSRDLLDHQGENEEVIALEFSTNSSNGLIFWHGQTPNEDGQGQDYISLTLQNGYLQYSFDLGQGAAIIQNRQVRVDNGERHNVILKRRGRRGTMDLDNTWMEEGDAEGYTTDMDCKGNIYIGGTPNIPLMTSSRVTQGFVGCIHAFELQNSQRLDLGMKAINGLNVKPCSSYADPYNNELVN